MEQARMDVITLIAGVALGCLIVLTYQLRECANVQTDGSRMYKLYPPVQDVLVPELQPKIA